MQHVPNDCVKTLCFFFLFVSVFLHLSVGLLNFVETQQQQQEGNIIHTTTTLSQARYRLASTSSSKLVFFAGGNNSTGASDRVDIYNMTSENWTTTTLSIPRYELAATSSQNLVFFGGGWNVTTYYDQVDIYNTLSGSWSTATLSQPRTALAATSVGNLVLFGGGRNSTTDSSNVVDVFDVTNNTWTTTTLSQPRSYFAATSVDNRYALFGGGYLGSDPSNVVDIFDSLSGVWSTTTISQARYFLAATSLGNLAFFGGGQTNGNQPSNVVDMLNVTSNTWFTVTLSQPRAALVSSSSNNKILFGGGLSNTGLSNIVDIIEISLPISQSPTPTSLPQNDTTTSTSSDSITGVVAGVVLTILLLLIGLGVIVLIYIRKRKRQQTQQNENERRLVLNQFLNSDLRKSSQIAFNELVVEKEIGEGSYGKVFVGKWNDALVALKFCRKNASIEDFVSEIKVMIELPPHPNVVQMFGVSLDGPQPVIILEYCAGGSLDRYLFSEGQMISQERKIELVQGISRGVFHLHKHNIVHRDLAARNILLTASGDPKISDFGMSRILEKSDEGKTKSGVGPICWMAPESIATRNYSKKSDIWSFGIVVYEIVAQREPHKDENVLEVAVLIRDQGLTPKIPQDCPPILREVMEMCWKKDPNQRPNIETICSMLSSRSLMSSSLGF